MTDENEQSIPSRGSQGEPVAWGVATSGGFVVYAMRTRSEVARYVADETNIVPLYRSPTLTAEEREAINWVLGDVADITGPVEDTLRGLLERTK